MRLIVSLLCLLFAHDSATAPLLHAGAADYRALVESYRHDGLPAVEQLLAMPHATVTEQIDPALAERSGWTWEELRAAAMLHSDGCIRSLGAERSAGADFHLTIAQRFLDRVMGLAPAQEDFAWRWYMVVEPLTRKLEGGGFSKPLRAYSLGRWAYRSGRPAYVSGLELEADGVKEPTRGQLPDSVKALRSAWFFRAAARFDEALKLNPLLGGAALHLGRIRMLQGHQDQAAALFQQALSDADPAVAYLAALFLGSLRERDERFEAAERLYRGAIERLPYGQSAPLALAQLLSRTGRESDAREVVAGFLLRSNVTPIVDPLWIYAAHQSEQLGTRYDLLRAEVWR